MARSIGLMFVVVVTLLAGLPAGALAQATPPDAPRESHNPSCNGLQQYWEVLNNAVPDASLETRRSVVTFTLVPLRELSTLRSEHLIVTTEYIDELAANVEEIDDVPVVVARLHEAYLGRLVLISRIAIAQSEGRAFDAMILIEQIDDNADVIRDQIDIVAGECGEQWKQFTARHPTAYPFMWPRWWDTQED